MPRHAPRSWLLPAALLLTAVWTLLSYQPVLQGPLFFDDEQFIVRNEMVHSLDHIGTIYRSGVTQGAHIAGNFYRPNQQLAFALLYHWVGVDRVWPYHALQIALHVVAGWALLALLLCLELPLGAATVGALVFLLHPVQTEAVSYVSGLADPLAAAFMLTALALAGRWVWRRQASLHRGQQLAVWLLLVLALLSKESAVVSAPLLVALVVASGFAHGQRPSRSVLVLAGGGVLLAGLSILLKLTVFNFSHEFGLTTEHNAYTDDLVLRLNTFVSVLWDYAKLVVWPAQLFYEKPYRAYSGWWTLRNGFGLLLLSGIFGLLARVRQQPRLALAGAWFFAALLPFVGIVPLNAMFLEHWLYMPMAAVGLLAALAWQAAMNKLWSFRPRFGQTAMATVALVLFSLATWRTAKRSAQWADVEAFYLGELEHTDQAGRIYNNLGMYYADHQQSDKAVAYYRKTLATPAGQMFAQPHHNLAMLYLHANDVAGALQELHAALVVQHDFVYSLAVLRDIYAYRHDEPRMAVVEAALNQLKTAGHYDFAALEQSLFALEAG